jgi:ABC-2 type transport system ATP-binding protein
MTTVIEAADLRRSYGDTVALDGVSMTVEAGEVLGLIGPNGAGKTTLVRALTGTTDAEGTVRLFGSDPTAVERSRIGLLPQSFDPADRLTARELLAYYAGLYDDTRSVQAVLEDVGLAEAASTHYENLSGGQQRRVCVGTALINDPDLLVLDEPTTGIDPAGRRAIWDLLSDLAASGTTILLTTHSMAEAHRLADRVAMLADGEIVALDTPEALVSAHGGATRLEIEISGEPPADIDLGGAWTVHDGRLVVRDIEPTAIGDVVDQLTDAGLEPAALSWREPDLEDVYLDLTGTAVDYAGEPVDPGDVAVAPPRAGSEGAESQPVSEPASGGDGS